MPVKILDKYYDENINKIHLSMKNIINIDWESI